MIRLATMTARSKTLWTAVFSLWVLTAGVGVHIFTLNLGAAHHDAACQDH